MKDLVSSRLLEVLALVPIALALVTLEGLRAIPRDPRRFAEARRVLLVVVVLLFGFLLVVIGGRFYYLRR